MGKLANKVAYELLDENESEGTAQLIWCVYTGLEHWENRVRRKLFGTELMDEYVTNYIWSKWREYCADDRKLTIDKVRSMSQGLVQKFEEDIKIERPVRERFLDILALGIRLCCNTRKLNAAQ